MAQSLGLFGKLSTATVFDASVRLRKPVRVAQPQLQSLLKGAHIVGRVLPARHYGSVDIFLEAMSTCGKGDVMVIDNGGRMDEACIGDLTTLEARAAGLAGLVVWGCHRDTEELNRIRFPVFSLGRTPPGPTKVRARPKDALDTARLGSFYVDRNDIVLADDDGVIFFKREDAVPLSKVAMKIQRTERQQAQRIRNGRILRDQLKFSVYLSKRALDPSYTFRKHLRTIGGEIEE